MNKSLHLCLLLCGLLCCGSLQAATALGDTLCVRLTTGAVDIFSPDILASQEQTADSLRLTLTTDTVVRYALTDIAAIDNSPGELPVFTSFKFNNKYNDQLPADVTATITPDEVTASVGAIGKWLTPSFQMSDERAVAYVDGVEQESKVSRLHFSGPLTYTLALPGMRTLTYRKVKDEVWSDAGADATLRTIDLKADMLSTNAPSNYEEGLDKLIDGDVSTFFHSTWGTGQYEKLPDTDHPYVQIQLAEAVQSLRFSYTTRNDTEARMPLSFALQASNDGSTWTEIRTFTQADGLPVAGLAQTYTSPTINMGRPYAYLRLVMLESNYKNYLCLAELSLQEVVSESAGSGPVLLSPAVYQHQWVPFGRDVTVSVDWLTDKATNVPRIDIDIENGAVPADKVTYLNAYITIDGGGVFPDFESDVRIRGRGNSSWQGAWGKSPYRLKFDSALKPFGLTKGKNWVLLANNQTNSMLTNALAMKIARLAGTAAANDIIPVELYLNGEYRGSYNFTQQIGLSNNSIDLDDETYATLLELDSYYDEDYKFKDSYYTLPVNVKDPDFSELTDGYERFALIQEDFNNFTATLKDGTDSYTDLLDVDMLARYLFVNELVLNCELMHPKSAYLYKEDVMAMHSRYVFGPVWDFDWAYGYEGSYNYCTTSPRVDYYTKLPGVGGVFYNDLRFNSEAVRRASYKVWKDFMENHLDEVADFVDEYYQYARPSLENNATRWSDGRNYATIASNMRSWILERAAYVYENMESFDLDVPQPVTTGDANNDGYITMADVVCVLNYMLGLDNETFNFGQADADGSGSITINDAVHIIALVMNQPATLARHLSLPQAAATLRPAAFEAALGVTADMPVSLNIAEGEYRAMQVDVALPEGLTLDDVSLTDMPGVQVNTSVLPDGTHRIALHTTDGSTLPAGESTLTLCLTATQMMAQTERVVSLGNALLATAAGEDCRIAPRSATFSLATATGIAPTNADTYTVRGGDALTIEALAPATIRIYTADGRLLRNADVQAGTTRISLPQGIYIVNQQKVIVK